LKDNINFCSLGARTNYQRQRVKARRTRTPNDVDMDKCMCGRLQSISSSWRHYSTCCCCC